MRLLAIISLALLAAACGSSPSSTTTGGSASNDPAQAPFKYATCMRNHGVTNFPDPQVTTTTTPGGTAAGVKMAVPATTAKSPKFKSAQKACQAILPAPGSSGPDHQGPSKQVLLAFASCLRSHGISNFPDPDAQGRLNLQLISAAGVDVRGPAFLTAAKACVGVTHGQIPMAAVEQLASGSH